MDPDGHQAASSGNSSSYPKLNDLYRVAASADCKGFDKIMEKYAALFTTSDKNSILHIATKFKWKTEVVGMIIDSNASLLYEKNSKGETPLHIAAGLGFLEIAKILVDSSSRTSGEFEVHEKLTMAENVHRDTPLHVAARHGHFKIVKLLIEAQDSEWPKPTNVVNNAGDSPLFLAVDRGFFNVASFLLKKTENCRCPYKGRDNINVLQTAVIRTHKVNKIPAYFPHGYNWRWLLHFIRYVNKLITAENCCELTSVEADVINTLMKRYPSAVREIDDFGWTPLHHAAHLGHDQTVRMFLKDHSDLAYMQDKKGMSILHLAAKEERIRVMKTLSNDYPDICKLLDEEGRTALHVAAESGKDNAVRYILKTPNLECLINEQDNQGNLASHLAARKGHFVVAAALVTDKRVDKGAVNREGLTAIDIIQSNTQLKYHDKIWLTRFLEESGGLHGLRHVGHEENIIEQSTEKRDPAQNAEPVEENNRKPYSVRTYTREHPRDIAQTSLLEATIIATVTFQLLSNSQVELQRVKLSLFVHSYSKTHISRHL